MAHRDDDNTLMNGRIPAILTLRDVFLMLTAVVSIMVAWGMFGTRLSVVEERMVSVKTNVVEIRQMIIDVRTETNENHKDREFGVLTELSRVESRLREVEKDYSRLEGLLKHQTP